MSDQATLQTQIDRVDAFISSLGPEGEAFVDQLRTRTRIDIDQGDFPSVAYFNAETMTSHFSPGVSFHELFNYRTHEGAHGIQCLGAPEAFSKLIGIETSNHWVSMSLADVITLKRITERNAYAVQAYFNAQAIHQTGDAAFVECLEENYTMRNLMLRQKALTSGGATPDEVRDTIALESLELREGLSRQWAYPKVSRQALLDFMCIWTYGKYARRAFNRHAAPRVVTDQEIHTILNAVVPMSPSVGEHLFLEARTPIMLSQTNRRVMEKMDLSL